MNESNYQRNLARPNIKTENRGQIQFPGFGIFDLWRHTQLVQLVVLLVIVQLVDLCTYLDLTFLVLRLSLDSYCSMYY